ncbi:hypothetical protein CPHO_03815 [Corynebacterium phocae]|uniref:Galactokinase N-terminal domain-containing protein n=2 Tax=Corynebacterium phocae TaxID=161895 RepID=A0A1L7D1Y5_9CORY|nr:galactokinase family protein [Corynebacterium phocae]APT92155.1 hypothetical protein CPHO_03815 [Corynebacterium phocae]KAA8725971.1 galactokinase [Corynebacterium phocae]
MPLWSAPSSPIAKRARALHVETFNTPAQAVATANGTWVLAGEHSDYYGGVTVVGLCDLQVAAAVSPRVDNKIVVTVRQPDGTTVRETSLDEIAALAAAQQPKTDEDGKPVLPPPPTGDLCVRAAGMVWAMVGRQMLSRETTGYSVAVVSDIPVHAGLGVGPATDAAISLALAGEPESNRAAPMRTRLSDTCFQVMTLFAKEPALRARHTAALRGTGVDATVIDYADGSVTHAPHPVGRRLAGFVIAVPGAAPDSSAEIRQRQQFIADASQAFGTDNLRLLPDCSQRVLDWLKAYHKVNGHKGVPSISEGHNWLRFFEEETQRSAAAARALRSNQDQMLYTALADSQRDIQAVFGLDSASALGELALKRGAVSAHAACAGMANAVVALVPVARAKNFAADLAADGLDVIELRPGAPAAHV